MEEMTPIIIISDIITKVIFPVIVFIVQRWISKKDVNEKNKGLGWWKMSARREFGFVDIALSAYQYFVIVFVSVYVIKGMINIFTIWEISFIVWGILYLSIAALFVLYVSINVKVRVEMKADRNNKWKHIISLYLICSIPLFSKVPLKFYILNILFFTLLLLCWVYCLFEYCDMAYIIDHKYADIYVREGEVVKCIETDSIQKKGEWVIGQKEGNVGKQEIRVRENDIVRMDYYGQSIIRIEKRKFLKKINN